MPEWRNKSPSSRAEWVEIPLLTLSMIASMSPSSRAEWVEINVSLTILLYAMVSVLAGGVG